MCPLKKIILPLTVCLLLISTSLSAQEEAWRFIPIAEQEHGYSNFQTTLITSAEQWKKFLAEDSYHEQMGWDNREAFEGAIDWEEVNFASEALLLVRDTEGSSAHPINLATPKLKKRTLYVRVVRNIIPGPVIADVAYYGWAIVVSKGAVDKIVVQPDGMNEQVFEVPYRLNEHRE